MQDHPKVVEKKSQIEILELKTQEASKADDKVIDVPAPKKKRNKREKVTASTTSSQSNSNEPTSLQAVMDAEVALGSKPSQKSWADRCGSGNSQPIMTEAPKLASVDSARVSAEHKPRLESSSGQKLPQAREDMNRLPRGGFRGGRARGSGPPARGGRGRGAPRGPYQNGHTRTDFNNGRAAAVQSTC